jgi:hypothetical protein
MVVKRKIPSPCQESNPRNPIVQPATQRYTDWAITALRMLGVNVNSTSTEGYSLVMWPRTKNFVHNTKYDHVECFNRTHTADFPYMSAQQGLKTISKQWSSYCAANEAEHVTLSLLLLFVIRHQLSCCCSLWRRPEAVSLHEIFPGLTQTHVQLQMVEQKPLFMYSPDHGTEATVDMTNRLRAGRRGFKPHQGKYKNFFSSQPLCPERLWSPSSFLFIGCDGLLARRWSGRGVKLTAHPHLVPRLPPLTHTPWWRGT